MNPRNYLRSDLKSVIHLISKKYSQLSRTNPDSFCPYIHIFGLSNSELVELKTELISENFKFKDGFDFNGSSFNPKSITEKATHYNGIKIKHNDSNTSLSLEHCLCNKKQKINNNPP